MIVTIGLLGISVMSIQGHSTPGGSAEPASEFLQVAIGIRVASEVSKASRLIFDLFKTLLLYSHSSKQHCEGDFGVSQVQPFLQRCFIEVGMHYQRQTIQRRSILHNRQSRFSESLLAHPFTLNP